MNNKILKLIWNKGITYEDYLYLYDSYGEGLLTVPGTLVDIERLRSKGYLQGYSITPEGIDLIQEVNGQESIKASFDVFWNLYPTKDPISGRELRHSYMEAFNLYTLAIVECSPEKLRESLEKEIAFRENSPTKFKFMKGIVSYLTSKEYLNVREVSTQRQYGKSVF